MSKGKRQARLEKGMFVNTDYVTVKIARGNLRRFNVAPLRRGTQEEQDSVMPSVGLKEHGIAKEASPRKPRSSADLPDYKHEARQLVRRGSHPNTIEALKRRGMGLRKSEDGMTPYELFRELQILAQTPSLGLREKFIELREGISPDLAHVLFGASERLLGILGDKFDSEAYALLESDQRQIKALLDAGEWGQVIHLASVQHGKISGVLRLVDSQRAFRPRTAA